MMYSIYPELYDLELPFRVGTGTEAAVEAAARECRERARGCNTGA